MKRARDNEGSCTDLMPESQRAHNGIVNTCHVSQFPVEVLQVLFAHLSMTDLYHCQLVCRQWNEIISRDGFLVWRKLYYRVKIQKQVEELKQFVVDEGLSQKSKFVENLIRLVKQLLITKYKAIELTERMLPILKTHPRYEVIEKSVLLQKLLHEDSDNPGAVLLSTLVFLIVLSKDVFQTKLVFDRLFEFAGIEKCTELFYCLATIFYYLWTTKVIQQRLHYQTYYVLKCFEKFKSYGGAYGLTQEQLAIVHHPIASGELVKVIAFAGTGKTTCLIHLAAQNPNKRFLYLCFNKAVAVHASKVFGRNVTCKTSHSLARRAFVGYHKDKVVEGSLRDSHIMKELKIPRGINKYTFAKYVLKTLEAFMASDDRRIIEKHLPSPNHARDQYEYIPEIEVLTETKSIWCLMVDKSLKVKMPHDGYLKVYQLQDPEIIGYDCILVDEAQDLNPAFLSILRNQSCSKVMVGDPHQQIYSFRGAINALGAIVPTHTYYLTESFRFGPNIAFLSSCLLDVLKGVQSHTLTGGYQPGGYSGVHEGQLACIARTNFGLFKMLVEIIKTKPDLKIAMAGSSVSYNFNTLLDIHRYMTNRNTHLITNGLVKKFLPSPFRAFEDYVNRIEDVPLNNQIRICHHYRNDLPSLIEKIQAKVHGDDMENADVIFSTVHKSKGLEFDTVVLADDYLEAERRRMLALVTGNQNPPLNLESLDADEKNLLYVAVTRAKKQVLLNPTVFKALERHEHFVHPSTKCDAPELDTHCAKCGLEHREKDCFFVKESFVLGDGRSLPGTGHLCFGCASPLVPHLLAITFPASLHSNLP